MSFSVTLGMSSFEGSLLKFIFYYLKEPCESSSNILKDSSKISFRLSLIQFLFSSISEHRNLTTLMESIQRESSYWSWSLYSLGGSKSLDQDVSWDIGTHEGSDLSFLVSNFSDWGTEGLTNKSINSFKKSIGVRGHVKLSHVSINVSKPHQAHWKIQQHSSRLWVEVDLKRLLKQLEKRWEPETLETWTIAHSSPSVHQSFCFCYSKKKPRNSTNLVCSCLYSTSGRLSKAITGRDRSPWMGLGDAGVKTSSKEVSDEAFAMESEDVEVWGIASMENVDLMNLLSNGENYFSETLFWLLGDRIPQSWISVF